MTPEELAKAQKEAADRLKAEAATAAKEAGKEAADTAVKEVKETADTAATDARKALDEIDKIALVMARVKSDDLDMQDGGLGTIRKALEDNKDKFAEFKASGKGRSPLSLEVKAIITTGAGSLTQQGTNGVILPQRLAGIVTQPERPEHVRDFLATSGTTSNLITYVREGSYTDGAAVVAEGGLKQQSDLALETKFAPVVKIATHFKVSEEALSDMPQLLGYITQRGQAKLMLVEDAQLLNGSGTSGNINGLRTQATAFAAGPLAAKVAQANQLDALRAAIAQVRRIEYTPSGIMMHPDDVAAMELTKATDGQYLLPTLLTGQAPTIGRVRIMETTLIGAGNFLVGDFSANAAQLFVREGITVRVYDQNEDDAIHNLVTIVIEERLALCVYRPEALVKGDFATAQAALLKA
ncbi:phage major capsid protein [Hymenobacter psychrophilus]|uniref:Phage major capsid protein, HK97 family n=1 Tax=Hymenobacter psychrophilus TaxID=651662 RepID=A0A1H3P9H5_9BACT|nr:phage major capsid protein [Hymenobacter psychrophilus]SDY97690.1 phage major capsid protein, HK97 family [Hymenobacter psychrophilus]